MPNDFTGSKLTSWVFALLAWVGARSIRRLDDLEERVDALEAWQSDVKSKRFYHQIEANGPSDSLPPESGGD